MALKPRDAKSNTGDMDIVQGLEINIDLFLHTEGKKSVDPCIFTFPEDQTPSRAVVDELKRRYENAGWALVDLVIGHGGRRTLELWEAQPTR